MEQQILDRGPRMSAAESGHGAASAAGSWTHSYEEDRDGVEVYRPTATYAFPPSRRGRAVLQFSGNAGQAVAVTALQPGADDRPRVASQPAFDIIEATPAILRLMRR